MRRAAKVDDNHAAIRDLLRSVPGVAVWDSSAFGGGFVDLIVRHGERVWYVEVKNPDMVPSKQRLTEAEEKFRSFIGSAYVVVKTKAEALRLVGVT